MTTRHQHRRTRGGFTLVELLVVVGIIAVLTGLIVVIVPKVKRSVYGAQTQAQMVAISTACQAYFNDFRAYPGPLSNAQLGAVYYPTANYPGGHFVYVLSGAIPPSPLDLQLGTGPLGTSETFATFAQVRQITGAENLVLGLLGGLELKTPAGGKLTFAYSDASLYPDGRTATPLGPLILNPTAPKRFGAYLQVKSGDLSNSRTTTMSGAPDVFRDEGGRVATDSPIPEFLDKFSNQMPILYLRANVGGTAIAAYGGQTDLNSGTAIAQTNTDKSTTAVIAQYDLAGLGGYTQPPSTGTAIGINPADSAHNHHGLQGLGLLTDAMTMAPVTVTSGYATAGKNGLAFLKDPTVPSTTNAPDLSTTPATYGTARQKDAFILISAGPDGIYGTADDIVYPGGTVGN